MSTGALIREREELYALPRINYLPTVNQRKSSFFQSVFCLGLSEDEREFEIASFIRSSDRLADILLDFLFAGVS